MHSTSLFGLLKEFRGKIFQNFVPSASAYAFGRRPNFLKQELRLRPNVKNTASVILWTLDQIFGQNSTVWSYYTSVFPKSKCLAAFKTLLCYAL